MTTEEIRRKLLSLEDTICELERAAGRGHTLILIPHDPREEVHISRDGKPVDISISLAVDLALVERNEP